MRVISGSARGTILHSIDEITTRPTLDRVKESLFNIINNRIDEDTEALDLFAGSGSIGIEFLSRGAKKTVFCDRTTKAIDMIKQNLTKTHLEAKAQILNKDYEQCLEFLKGEKFDVIYIDPPYKENLAANSVKLIDKYDLLKENGIIIVETDEKDRDVEEIEKTNTKFQINDLRKYGRAHLIFLGERSK